MEKRREVELPPLPEMPEPDDTDDCTYAAHSSEQLEAYARAYGELCARMAREQERERCAKLCEDHIVTDHHADGVILKKSANPFIHDGKRYAAAIRSTPPAETPSGS